MAVDPVEKRKVRQNSSEQLPIQSAKAAAEMREMFWEGAWNDSKRAGTHLDPPCRNPGMSTVRQKSVGC
jgi:hypothetical protein